MIASFSGQPSIQMFDECGVTGSGLCRGCPTGAGEGDRSCTTGNQGQSQGSKGKIVILSPAFVSSILPTVICLHI